MNLQPASRMYIFGLKPVARVLECTLFSAFMFTSGGRPMETQWWPWRSCRRSINDWRPLIFLFTTGGTRSLSLGNVTLSRNVTSAIVLATSLRVVVTMPEDKRRQDAHAAQITTRWQNNVKVKWSAPTVANSTCRRSSVVWHWLMFAIQQETRSAPIESAWSRLLSSRELTTEVDVLLMLRYLHLTRTVIHFS